MGRGSKSEEDGSLFGSAACRKAYAGDDDGDGHGHGHGHGGHGDAGDKNGFAGDDGDDDKKEAASLCGSECLKADSQRHYHDDDEYDDIDEDEDDDDDDNLGPSLSRDPTY